MDYVNITKTVWNLNRKKTPSNCRKHEDFTGDLMTSHEFQLSRTPTRVHKKKIYIYTSYNCIYHPKNKTLCCKEKITNSSAYTILNVQTLTFILTIPLQAFEPNMKPIYHLEEPPRKIRKRFHLSPRTSGVKRRPTEPNMASKLDIFRIPWCLEWFSFWSLMMCMVMYDDMYVYFLKYMCIYIYIETIYTIIIYNLYKYIVFEEPEDCQIPLIKSGYRTFPLYQLQ